MTRPHRLGAAGLALSLGLGLLTACTGAGAKGIPHKFEPGTYRLISFDSCADALRDLRAATGETVSSYGYGIQDRGGAIPPGAAPVPSAAKGAESRSDAAAPNSGMAGSSGSSGNTEPQYSGTNSHEAAADEPDLIKTDGHRLITVSGSTLRVIDADTKRVAGIVDLTDPSHAAVPGSASQLLLFGDRALILMHETGMVAKPLPATGGATAMDVAGSTGTQLILVSLPGQPSVLSRMHVAADLLDARQTGSTARVVVESHPNIMVPYVPNSTQEQYQARARSAVDQMALESWLPRIDTTTGKNTSQVTIGCDDISRPEVYSGTSILTVLSFDLGTTSLGDGRPVVLVADGKTLYGNGSSLYVATDQRWRPQVKQTSTELYKFNVTGERPVFVAGGSIPGYLINQYALSEWQGNLRAATTTNPTSSSTRSESAVYVLAQDGEHLTIKGSLTGLGKNERIYAVRFTGNIGYVVTFRQTDPLYTVDLTDPTNPRLRGELKIPGYSAYLHPGEGTKLIGVGQNANAQGRISGTQVSLFDVANLDTPTRVATYTLSGGRSDAEFDPHAFLYWPATGLLVIPIQGGATTRAVPPQPNPGPIPVEDQAKVGFAAPTGYRGALVLKLTGSTITEVGFLTHPTGAGDDYYGFVPAISRSVLIDQTLWTLSSGGLLASNVNSLSRIAWIPFS